MIAFASPLAGYQRYRAEYDAAYQRVMASGRYILGPEVAAFEAEFAAQCGARFALGVASGTEALWLALRALPIGAGDEVLVPSLTASATVAAIVETGAAPVFVDSRDADLNVDPELLPACLTSRTRALVAVHLYGNPADLEAISAFCRANGLRLIEDCAQAHGARYGGRSVGSFGEVAAWSFYPTKNLGAFGDGGLVTTGDEVIAERLRLLREYGWRTRYHSDLHGWNSRLDELQAALLRVKLAHLEADNERRRAIARAYRGALPAAVRGPSAQPDALGVEHLFVIRHRQRDRLRQLLEAAGVSTAVHYPAACHVQNAYVAYGRGPGSLLQVERATAEVLSLPMYPELGDAEVETVIAAVREAVEKLSG